MPTNPADDFRRIRIAAAAFQMRHFLDSRAEDALVCDWFRHEYSATWSYAGQRVAVAALGIEAEAQDGTHRSALAAWIANADRAAEGAPPMEPLDGFLATHDHLPLDQLVGALRSQAKVGDGVWMEPAPGLHHPGTHLHEVSFLDVTGRGADEIEAARNWRKLARAVAGGAVVA